MRMNALLLALFVLLLAPGLSPGQAVSTRKEVCVVFLMDHENILKSYPREERAALEALVVDGLINGPNSPAPNSAGDAEDGTAGLSDQFRFLSFSTDENAKNRMVVRIISTAPAGTPADISFQVKIEGESVDEPPPPLEWNFRDFIDYASPVKPREDLVREIVTKFLETLEPAAPGKVLAQCLSAIKVREGGLQIKNRLFALPFSCHELSVSDQFSVFVAEVSIAVPENPVPLIHRIVLEPHGPVVKPEDGDLAPELVPYLGKILASASKTANKPEQLELLDHPACKAKVLGVFISRYAFNNKCLESEQPSNVSFEDE